MGLMSTPEPATRSWPWWPLYVYLGLGLVVGWWAVGGDPNAPLPPESGWFFVPPFLYLAASCLVTGRAPAKLGEVSRRDQPGLFWLLTVAFLACAVLMALMGLGVFA